MKQRITALFLALGLTAGLAACTGGQEPQAPAPDPSQDIAVTDPAATPIPDKGTPPPEYTHHPDDHTPEVTHHPDDHTPEVTHHPDDHHPEVPANTPSPTPEPTPEPDPSEPSDTPSIAVPAANEVYAAVSKSAGNTTATMDASSVLENFYDLSADDLEDYVLYIPELSANIEEIFIVRAKPGKASAVKSACESRLTQLQDDAEMYPATGAYVANYQLVTEGDWVLFCVCPDSAGAVKAFQDCVR